MSESSSYDYEPEQRLGSTTTGGVASYSLRWNSFQAHLTKGMGKLLEKDEFTDVTLACDGQFLKAHKLVLSLCSPYFKRLFQANNRDKSGTTIVILNNVRFIDLENIIRFIYHGEANVNPADLSRFIKTGELLQIEGLAQTKLPNQVVADGGVDELSTHLSPRTLSGVSNDTRYSSSKSSVDKTFNNRTVTRQKSFNEPQSLESILAQPPSKRIKTANTPSVTPRLQSILAGIANAASSSATEPLSNVPDVPRSRSVLGHSLAAAVPVEISNDGDEDHNNALQTERDPLELVSANLSSSTQLVDLTTETEDGLYSGVDPDENFSESDAIYTNSSRTGSGMDDNNGVYGQDLDESISEGPVSSQHQLFRGNRDTKLKTGRKKAPNGITEMQRHSADNRGHHFIVNDGDRDFDDAGDKGSTGSPVLDWVETADSRFLCTLCGKTYRSKNVLYNHRSVYHRSEYRKNTAYTSVPVPLTWE